MRVTLWRPIWLTVWRERAGVVSPSSAWCCSYDGCYLHLNSSLFGLIREVIMEFRHDRHLAGWGMPDRYDTHY